MVLYNKQLECSIVTSKGSMQHLRRQKPAVYCLGLIRHDSNLGSNMERNGYEHESIKDTDHGTGQSVYSVPGGGILLNTSLLSLHLALL